MTFLKKLIKEIENLKIHTSKTDPQKLLKNFFCLKQFLCSKNNEPKAAHTHI